MSETTQENETSAEAANPVERMVMPAEYDTITEPEEWIDGLVKKYSPRANDIDVAIQNMGLRIGALETTITTFIHDIDGHDDDRNGPIIMSSLMWLQVEAFRTLLGKA